MTTSLKQFAEAFDVTSEEMYILMLADKEAFRNLLTEENKRNTGNVRLDRESMDHLEHMFSDKSDIIEVPLLEVADVLGCTEIDINEIISENAEDFKRMTKFVKADNTRYIKFKCIEKLVIKLRAKQRAKKREEKKAETPSKKPVPKIRTEAPVFMPLPEEPKEKPKAEVPAKEEKNEPPAEVKEEKPAKPTEVKTPKKKTKKKKYAITKTYLREHGLADSKDMRAMRMFLLETSDYKAEEIALMSDRDITDKIAKEYFILPQPECTVIIRRESLESIVDDIYVIKEGD